MENQILLNLENLLNDALSELEGATINGIISDYIDATNQGYLSLGITHYLDDEEPIALNKLKENHQLKAAFNKVLEFKTDENKAILNFKSQLQHAFIYIQQKNRLKSKEIINQAFSLVHDYRPIASIIGWGTGEYPLIDRPKYLRDSPYDDIYYSFEAVDYSSVWNDLISLNELIEQYEIDDIIYDSEIYEAISRAYQYRTYILLNKALNELGPELFDGMNIKTPFMIYGHQHGCKQVSIYVFE